MAEQPPTRSFLRCRGSGMWRKASSEMGRTEPREWAEGNALQREGCEAVSTDLCSVLRVLRGDLINGKIVLAFLFVCRITVDLKSTPSHFSKH